MSVKEEKINRVKAGIGTGITIAVILVLLLISSFSHNEVEMEANEGGVEVQFGNPDDGGPDTEPASSEEEASSQPEEVVADDVYQTDNADVSQQVSDKPKIEKTPVKEEPKPTKDKAISDLADQLKNAKKPGGGDGGDTKGNKGDPDSDGDAPEGGKGGKGDTDGLGSGLVDGFSLKGRKIDIKPNLSESFNSRGKVVVDILVGADGKVILANPGGSGTSTSDTKLFELAKKLAIATKFTPIVGGNTQNGTITFNFQLK